jgi:predicted dehydrogenase
VKIGVVGCGKISDVYLSNLQHFSSLRVVACADLIMERAVEKAARHGVPRALPVEALLADPEIDLVLNLTIPAAHAEIALAAVRAGKSVYNEKPLAIELADAKRLLEEAQRRGVRVGCAPDTFLGAGLQACRDVIDRGVIGTPVAATAFMLCHGHESWHPDPAFYYAPGGGPLFDMGPYYLTALVALLGPIHRVTGAARASFPTRTVTSEPRRGETIPVHVPTHVSAVLEFTSGPIATLVTSFDVWAHEARIEIYGSDGTLSVPDPNTFGGPVRWRRRPEEDWTDVPLPSRFTNNWRGVGVAELAAAARAGRPHRASGDLAYHVLEAMHGIHIAAETGQRVTLASSVPRPEPLPAGEWPLDAGD